MRSPRTPPRRSWARDDRRGRSHRGRSLPAPAAAPVFCAATRGSRGISVRDTACYPASQPDKTGHSERVRGSCTPRAAHPAGPAWERRLDAGNQARDARKQAAGATRAAAVRQRRRRFGGPVSAAEDLAVDFSPRPELERVLQRCTELLGCDAGSICSVDEGAGTYRKEADIGVACQSGQVFPLTEGMTGTVVARREAVWFDRYDQVPSGHVAGPERATLRGVIGVPLEWSGRVIGACIVFSRDSRRVFGPGDAELLELFARHEAIVLATARLREAAEVSARAEAVAAELSLAAGRLRTASREAMDALADARLTLLGLAPAALHGPSAAGLDVGGAASSGLAGAGPSPAGGPRLRVLIAADRPLLRAGIGRLLAGSGAAADAGYAGTGFAGPGFSGSGFAGTGFAD